MSGVALAAAAASIFSRRPSHDCIWTSTLRLGDCCLNFVVSGFQIAVGSSFVSGKAHMTTLPVACTAGAVVGALAAVVGAACAAAAVVGVAAAPAPLAAVGAAVAAAPGDVGAG